MMTLGCEALVTSSCRCTIAPRDPGKLAKAAVLENQEQLWVCIRWGTRPLLCIACHFDDSQASKLAATRATWVSGAKLLVGCIRLRTLLRINISCTCSGTRTPAETFCWKHALRGVQATIASKQRGQANSTDYYSISYLHGAERKSVKFKNLLGCMVHSKSDSNFKVDIHTVVFGCSRSSALMFTHINQPVYQYGGVPGFRGE